MSTNIYAAVLDVLSPLVGRPIAEICIRSSTVYLGKRVDELTPADLPHISRTIRDSLGSFTTQAVLERAIGEINERVSE
jgi:hypothetical protein